MEDFAIVRNVQNNQFYMYLGNNKYRNMVTDMEGEIEPEKAQKVFKINLSLTQMCHEFPMIIQLIKQLGLKADTN